MKSTGYFDNINKEYVITNMKPRRPLDNYLWNENFLLGINHMGFGSSFMRLNGNMRRPLFAVDEATRLVYIKDNDTGEIYDINRNYAEKPFDKHQCHVGIGYHKITSEYNGIISEYIITVPENAHAELWQIRITNNTSSTKNLSVVSYSRPHVNVTGHLAYGHADFDSDLGGLYFCHDAFLRENDYCAVYVKSNIKPDSYDVSDVNFKGIYNEYSNPISLKSDALSNKGSSFDNSYCAALQFNLKISSNETKVINIAAGIATSVLDAKSQCKEYLTDGYFENSIKSVKSAADSMDEIYSVNTPDDYINTMVNVWLKRQISLGKTWGRIYSKGFRDIMQDVAALVSFGIDASRSKIVNCLEHQRYNGNPLRAFDPISNEPYYDGAAWIPATLLAYIKESGDKSILELRCKYYDNDVEETIFEHMYKGIRFLLDNRGANNLVLWGGGDWNDSINNVGNQLKGESVWLSIATVKAITELCEIIFYVGGYDDLKSKLLLEQEILKKAIIENGFESDRFIYGINDWNEKVGSKDSKEGKLYLNPQTWAVLADILDTDGCKKVMQTVEDNLKCEYGYIQCSPAYSVKDEHIGRMAYFIPGGYENGSVYNHGVAFKIIADCKLGKNDTAYETFNLIRYDNPSNANSGVEPYVMSNMYLGPQEHYRAGFAPCSWITGTAGWLYRDITEYIIGIRAEFNGLKIDPCLPSAWDSVDVSRIYRGAVYNISIRKTGRSKISVDGNTLQSNIIPVFEKGTKHTVVFEF